jgi:hypothetical protein
MRRLPARFDDLRIKHKILAGHIALIIPLGAIVILVAAMGSQILAQSASISRDLVPALANLEHVRSTGLDVIETTNTYVVTSLNGRRTRKRVDRASPLRPKRRSRPATPSIRP